MAEPLPGRDYYQYPEPFPLADEVATAEGKTFTGRRARVYWLLRETLDRGFRHRVGRRQGPPGWVPRFLLVEPWSGGSSGDRRARELREYGVELEIKDFEPDGGEGSTTTLYRIERDGIRAGGPEARARGTQSTTPIRRQKPTGSTRSRTGSSGRQPAQTQTSELAGTFAMLIDPELSDGDGLTDGTKPPIREPRANGPVFTSRVRVDFGLPNAISPSIAIRKAIEDRIRQFRPGVQDTAGKLDEMYLSELREKWRSGEIRRLMGHQRVAIEIHCRIEGSTWTPLPMLYRALTSLGAQVEPNFKIDGEEGE